MVDEATAIGGVVERPAGRVHDQPGAKVLRPDLPQFLDANAIALRIAVGIQPETFDQGTTQMPARTLGKHRVAAQQLHARLEGIGGLPVTVQTHVARHHATDLAFRGVEHPGGRKAGVDLHPQRLGLHAQPARQLRQADDVVAMVLHGRRRGPDRHLQLVSGRQEHHLVGGSRRHGGRIVLLPAGQQLVQRAGVDDRARQDVRADLGAFLDHADADVLAAFGRQLLQADGRGQPCRACAHHHHIEFHGIAFDAVDRLILPHAHSQTSGHRPHISSEFIMRAHCR